MTKHGLITCLSPLLIMSEGREEWLDAAINHAHSIHILGAGLNPERPAHRAVHDLNGRGWRLVPIHPRDAGNSILGRVIRPEIEPGITPDIVVMFLAPARAQAAVMSMIVRYGSEHMPLIWLQRGAESDELIEMLEENALKYVKQDCIVEYITRNNMQRNPRAEAYPWFRQISDEDGSGCSVWQAFEPLQDGSKFTTELEWVGDLSDLENSQHTIARYIRSLGLPDEQLIDTAIRLA